MRYMSPSSLGTLRECHRCYWLQEVLKLKFPRGAFPSLPGGLDRVVKAYCDKYRAAGELPPELAQHLAPHGTFKLYPDQAVLRKWRYYKTAPAVVLQVGTVEVKLQGAYDDVLICVATPDQGVLDVPLYLPFDGKSKGSEPKDDGSVYYQTQIDSYGLMMNANGLPIFGKGILWYMWPKAIKELASLEFGDKIYFLSCEPERAMNTVALAVSVLSGQMPGVSQGCERCEYVLQHRNHLAAIEDGSAAADDQAVIQDEAKEPIAATE